MSDNSYIDSIISSIPDIFYKIYVIDTLKDLISEYSYQEGKLDCTNTMAFTSFYSDLNDVE